VSTGAPRPADARKKKKEYRGKYAPRRKVCGFCVDKINDIDYKDVPRLKRYLSERAKIEPRRKTGTCARHQRGLTVALKRARHVALLPFTAEHIRLSGFQLRG
jgi:small subunit ribosomal protein S18